MGIEMIGRQIASMRKQRGVKQEELANYVGVTAQAVSKWENGGVPDTEILPKIADFFGVSMDSLFGRSLADYGNLQTALCEKIVSTPLQDRFLMLLDYCWDMERALFGRVPNNSCLKDDKKAWGEQDQIYSSVITDDGFTRMGIANRLSYFLLVPEIRDTQAAFFNGIDYLSFFRDFSDPNVFDACVMLNKRENSKAFTPNLFVKAMGMQPDQAVQVIATLEKYGLLRQTQIEMDDEIQTVYHFIPTPSFIALLIFAREMIEPPNNFCYYQGGRNKPYLK